MMKRKRLRSVLKWLGLLFLLCIAGIVIVLYVPTAVTKNTDSYIYDLPFEKGTSHKVVQGYGGLFSHKNTAAIDFEMPVGTPVLAAREGVVYAYKDSYDEGGPFSKYKGKANFIMIQHSDGSYGCYWHLKKHGVITKTGKVKKESRLAGAGPPALFSGRTCIFQ
ncbi:M23 family metallopeptidase [Terrimonas rubra]|uniref:M23 family metallopeptidase n=1 Tax=Terrimonas rubra TaxID=1035890 RepID=A0ABW5ZZ82_9BACT